MVLAGTGFISTGGHASLASSCLVICKQRTKIQSYFAAFASQDYIAVSFANVSHHLSRMTIDHIAGILWETQCVKHNYVSPILSLLY